ncbi:MAG: aminotransferase class III-fold pyridoxal phosphate-dependent enzyme [Alphaproteobacteria bacterium]|jgi:glutamate-1-semialdehyde 2,1-aminomutase|nr:aminotransferase class III-fold pyridoxal phosphate-dependent enzyme [Alphaproteobacteria bacterium]
MSSLHRGENEQALVTLANQVLPAGGFGNLASHIVIEKGLGGRVWDVSGNEYVDLLLGSGPMLVGHGNAEVLAAAQEQLQRGTTFFTNNEAGIRLAAEIVDAVACADKVRFVSTGSEATFYAMRLARAHRKRDKILKFEGAYHGMSDYALMSLAPKRPGNFPQATPDSAGIPRWVRDEVLIAPFNDAETAASLIREYHDDLGGIIVEPMQRVLPPQPGFLETLRELATQYGIPLIFDEVVTGFRFAYGGAQAYYGVTPDLCALGKVIGGGLPLAAIGGRADIMAHFDRKAVEDEDFMPQKGTLSGNPVAAVAGLATLEILKRPGAYETIFATGKKLMQGLDGLLQEAGIPAQVIGEPPLFDVFFTSGDIKDYRGMQGSDLVRARRFNGMLREHGVLKGDTKFYVSLAHDEADVAKTLDAFAAAAKSL